CQRTLPTRYPCDTPAPSPPHTYGTSSIGPDFLFRWHSVPFYKNYTVNDHRFVQRNPEWRNLKTPNNQSIVGTSKVGDLLGKEARFAAPDDRALRRSLRG